MHIFYTRPSFYSLIIVVARRSLRNVNKWFDILLNCLLLMFSAFRFRFEFFFSLFFHSLSLWRFTDSGNSIFDYRRRSDSYFHCSFITIDVSFQRNAPLTSVSLLVYFKIWRKRERERGRKWKRTTDKDLTTKVIAHLMWCLQGYWYRHRYQESEEFNRNDEKLIKRWNSI